MACHNNLVAPSGEDVSIGATWRSTMMANSARDPYWQAGVRRETIDHPTHSAAIQDECAGCHMPMATRIARESGGRGEVFPSRSASARAGGAAPPRRGRRLLFRLPSDLERASRYARELQRRVRDRTDAGFRRAADLRPLSRGCGTQDDHALGERVCAGGSAAHQAIGVVRDVSHADHDGLRSERAGGRIAAGADELSGVAAQRFPSRGAKLSVLSHAGSCRADSRGLGARRYTRHAGAPCLRRRQRLHDSSAQSLSS